jgi:hypothetical protein
MKTIKTNDRTNQAMNMIKEACKILQSEGQPNPLQPGFLKELAIAEIFEHDVVIDKHQADGVLGDDYFEYLTCSAHAKSKCFAFDGMKNGDDDSMNKSLSRISRNKDIIFAIFDGLVPTHIYKCGSSLVYDFVKRNLIRRKISKNNEHTVNIPLNWVKLNCDEVKF